MDNASLQMCTYSIYVYKKNEKTKLCIHVSQNAQVIEIILYATAMVEGLASKTTAWENERGLEFTYDGVSFL